MIESNTVTRVGGNNYDWGDTTNCQGTVYYPYYPGYYQPQPVFTQPVYVMPPMPQFYPNSDISDLIKALNRLAEAMEKQNVR